MSKMNFLDSFKNYSEERLLKKIIYMKMARHNIKRHIRDYIDQQLIKAIVYLISRSSDGNAVRLLRLTEFLAEEYDKSTVHHVRKCLEEHHPVALLARRILLELNPKCRDMLVNNFFLKGLVTNYRLREKYAQKHGFVPPYLIVISPTMRCNLRCYGCYSGAYVDEEKRTSWDEELEYEVVDKILTEAKEMGIHFITISGGEPTLRKDLLPLYAKHDDMYFHMYSNGHVFTSKDVTREYAELGNIAVMISIEGFEKETDERRGKGAFTKVMKAMDNLREAGMLFGYSATVTRHNFEIVSSYEFVDLMLEKGCYVGWYFHYVPVGKARDMNLMMTPEQRNELRERVSRIRNSRPIFLGDFWNDGPYSKGCLSGGQMYVHINSRGDIEPCVFLHFAVDNIKTKSLRDALNSRLFKMMRDKRPYSKNLLAPCIIIDNPGIWQEIYKECKPYPTDDSAMQILNELRIDLEKYAESYHRLTDPIWEKEWTKPQSLEKQELREAA